MLLKKINYILLTIFLTFTAYSINISSCDDDPTTNGTYILNQSVSYASAGTCLGITSDNVTLNCNGFNITGASNGYAITVNGYNNITILNCNIYNFQTGIELWNTQNITISNIKIYDSTNVGIYLGNSNNSNINRFYINNSMSNNIDLSISYSNIINDGTLDNAQYNGVNLGQSNNNTFSNIIVNNTNFHGIYSDTSHYNTYNNIKISNSGSNGFVLKSSSNNTLSNSNFQNNNTLSNIYFEVFAIPITGNILYNNYLGDSCKINFSDWTQTDSSFNVSTTGNYYTSFSCFDGSNCFLGTSGNICDYFASTGPSTPTDNPKAGIFPLQKSPVLALFTLFFYLLM